MCVFIVTDLYYDRTTMFASSNCEYTNTRGRLVRHSIVWDLGILVCLSDNERFDGHVGAIVKIKLATISGSG